MTSQSIPVVRDALEGYSRLEKTPIEVVVFDFDGTIADTLDAIVGIVNELAQTFGYPVASPEELETYKNLSSRQILRRSGISLFQLPFVILKAQRALSAQIDRLQPFVEIEASLRALKGSGYKLGILTSNSQKNVEAFLQANQLDRHFDFIYSGLTVFGKERLFRKMLRRENLDRERIVYIGDETRDIESARNVQIKSIAVSWGFNSRQALLKFGPDRAIDSPRELLSAVRSLSTTNVIRL
ncbi:MAG: HAD-IA family hydrolase [Cyanobacteria bacterium SID2]|nr:HAD-IA family hydrolase [Cyanobacteria bacterium SID2]MBP0002922.1 HAD-IA family hydrolase [Cyanobacteria bacterium SBC]